MTIVIGGGFYGAMLAERLALQGESVTLIEKENRLLARASAINQARVHQGYHYPRSILTGRRSQANYGLFVQDFSDAVQEDVDAYYAIARLGSKVTARQFQIFCERIHAPLQSAPAAIQKLFQPELIEAVFKVREAVFHVDKLRTLLDKRLTRAGVKVILNTRVDQAEKKPGEGWRVHLEGDLSLDSAQVYVCVYSELNRFLAASHLPMIALKQEVTEMALVELPAAFHRQAITLMCGPFFSILPFPSRVGLHTLSHVRYTPHAAWLEDPNRLSPAIRGDWPETHFPYMVRDAARFVPRLAEAKHRQSLWEIKTVLPASEVDDSRPILFRRDHGGAGLTCILGGKIDNVYDMQKELAHVPY